MVEDKKKKPKKVAKTIYISKRVDAAIEAHMRRESLNNYSVAVQDALEFALFPEYRDERHQEMTKNYAQLLYSFNEHRKHTARDFAVIQETLFQFMKEFYKNVPEPLDSEDAKTEIKARERFDAFLETVVANINQKPMKPNRSDAGYD